MKSAAAVAVMIVVAGFMRFPGIAAAQEPSPERCAALTADTARLECYDFLFRPTISSSKKISPGKWNLQTETSPMTDQQNVFLSVDSEEVVNCGWNQGARINLTLRCMENTTALIFGTGCHMTSSEYNDYGHVTYRIDEQPPRTVAMEESTDHRSLGLWNGGSAIPEIKKLLGAKRLLARMTPYSENPFTASFDITGLEAAVTPLREACGW